MNCNRIKINQCCCVGDSSWSICKSVEGLIKGLESHKWNKDEGSKAIYDSAIDDAIAYIKEYLEVNNNENSN